MMEIVKIEVNEMTDPPFIAFYAKHRGALSYKYEYVGQAWKSGGGIGIAFDGEGDDWLHFTPKQFIEFTNKIKALEFRGLESKARNAE